MRSACEDRAWRIQISSQANYCFESIVFVYQTIQSKKKKKKKLEFKNLVYTNISGFMYDFLMMDG